MSVTNPFDICGIPHVLFGTGQLYVTEGMQEIAAGNFSSVDLVQEGAVSRYFSGADEDATPLGVTDRWRLILTGDTFSIRNLQRILNLTSRTGGSGETIFDLKTVRAMRYYEVRFEKDITRLDCDEEPCFMDIVLWRAHFDLPQTWTFAQDEPTIHVFNVIAIPNPSDHPNAPFGEITTCPGVTPG
jgi:hypothetical protein